MTPTRRLSAILDAAGIRPLAAPGADPEIGGVGLDSRVVSSGELFLALPGLKRRGEEFLPQAIARGASAVLAATPRPSGLAAGVAWVQVEDARRAAGRLSREFHGRPDESLCLVGVTGTNGKTTVTYLVESMARAAGRAPGRIGTVGYAWGGSERPAPHTTPEAPDLFRMLAEMVGDGVDLVAMEVSSHALALGRVEGASFRVGALVSFGRDHLDFHGTIEAYFEAKAALFDRLDSERATAVLPSGSDAGRRLAARTRARVWTFGRAAGSTVRLSRERCDLAGSSALLETPAGPIEIRTPLVGALNLENVAAAAACALAAGCPPEAVAAGAAALARVPGRLERVDAGQPFAVLVDYAHTPDALARLLEAVRSLARGRTLLVFGCGGDRDRGKRPEMGRIAAAGADLVILTSDNPRGEDPETILREIEAGIPSASAGPERLRTIADRAGAIAAAVASARPGDALLVAGKGHETTQTIGDRAVRLDDRELLKDALASRGYAAGRPRAGA